MRNTRKIFVALLVVFTLLMSMTIVASAAKTTVPTTLYLTPNANWKADNARFALYTWDGGDKWFDMTDSDGDGVYECTIPAGIENIIFCRMNPNASANNWNNKWNQTADLKYSASSNHYTVKEGTWDKGGGTWSLLEAGECIHSPKDNGTVVTEATCTTDGEVKHVCSKCNEEYSASILANGHSYTNGICSVCSVQATYTVAGANSSDEASIFGTSWDTTNTANDMTFADGVYTKVYENVPAGTYKFKCAQDHSWNVAYPSADKSFTVSASGSTVTITLKGTTVDVKVDLPHIHSWSDATCTEAQKCECGETQGEALGHTYAEGVCSVCGAEDPNYVPPHEHNFVEGKCECGESDPNYVPPHVNALVVGDTNKIVVNGETLNAYNLPIEWVAFVADEKAHYKFVGDNGALAYIFDLEYNAVCGYTGEADLEAGTYLICVGNGLVGEFNVAVTKSEIPAHEHTFVDGKCECGESDPNYVPDEPVVEPETPKLALGDNTVVIDGSETNLSNQPIAWLELVVTSAGTYKVSSADLNCFICSAKDFYTNLCGWTGIAVLEPGTYYVAVGNAGITGEFTVTLETDVEAPAVNTVVVGENNYVVNQALKDLGYEFTLLVIDKAGTYNFSGLSSFAFYIWPDYPNQETVPSTAPFLINVDPITFEILDSMEVELTEGFYLIGFKFINDDKSIDTPVGEYKVTISYVEKPVHEHNFVDGKCECGESDPNYVAPDETPDEQPEDKPVETPDEQPAPEQPAPKLNFFQKIWLAIVNFFKSLFGKKN